MHKIYSSELVQRAAINDIAESVMAFNTNYKDTGLFGVYAVAKVSAAIYLWVEVLHSILFLYERDGRINEQTLEMYYLHRYI